MRVRLITCAGVVLLAAGAVTPADPPAGRSPAGKLAHMVALPDDVKWVDGPPGLPPGAQMAVLDGDPTKPGLFTVRAKMPDGYIVPPHWHSADENLTIISGSFGLGVGDKLEPSKVRYLPAGSYARLGKEERHYAICKGETVIQVHAVGPFDIHYVNPADDPTKK
ncbi:MAG: cupin domain-containing protein [Zavarzinella sp.]|nr:cupin domain-containing protein [Zavarzinella sp.]